jgi:hypothetical protein
MVEDLHIATLFWGGNDMNKATVSESIPRIPIPENSKRTRRDTATPISRPVYMLYRNFNLNPVIEVHSR